MLREKTDLIIKDLNFKELNHEEIATCLEISYVLNDYKEKELFELNDLIKNYSNDGILTFGLFVLFCYQNYCKYEYWDIYDFLYSEIKNCIADFKNKYFEEIKE